MNILLVHQNFPGQFRHLAPALAKRGHSVSALGLQPLQDNSQQGVKHFRYSIARANTPDQHPWVIDFESKVIRGQACLRAAIELDKQGYRPDVIVAHPGWGESLFLKEVWPEAKLGIYCEFFYQPDGLDVGFDTEFQTHDYENKSRVRLKNVNDLLHMQIADAGICPTEWQASTYPEFFRSKMSVIHDGIDTAKAVPEPKAFLTLNDSLKLTSENQVITFVNRNLEPLRGFHTFMRALPQILRSAPEAQILIVGDNKQGYGTAPPTEDGWAPFMIEEIKPKMRDSDWQRVHFLGKVPYNHYLTILQISSVHVYLTYPFVLSWSLLEAMSVGCRVVGSLTPPVMEVIKDGETGLLRDFFDPDQIAQATLELLNDKQRAEHLGQAARRFVVENLDLHKSCLPKQIDWVETLSPHFTL